MNTYTVFCRDASDTGTTWISTVKADSLEEAIETGRFHCCWDWGYESEDDIFVIGVAEGDVHILYWEDI